MTENKNIPKHWVLKTFRDVYSEIQSGKRPKGGVQGVESGVPSIGAEHLNSNGGFKFERIRFVPEQFAEQMKKGIIQKDDIIVVKDGATTAKTSYVSNEFPFQFAVINEHVFILRLKEEVLPKFGFYKLFSIAGRKEILQDFRGAAQGGISSNFIDNVTIPIPPLPEQIAIVSKIEELFSELDNGKQQLLTAQQQLKVYRQSLLKAAFEGKLTAAWREAQKQKENVVLALAAEPGATYHKKEELPEGWEWTILGEVLDKIEAGKSFKCDERPPKSGETGVLKVSAVTWQIFDENESKTVLEKERINSSYFVKENDFIFSRANTLDLIGAVVLVKSINKKLMLSDKTLRFVFKSGISKKYILYYLRSPKGRKEIQRLSTGNQESMRNIGQERIKQIEFSNCSIEEQLLIVDVLESKLTVCDKMEETIAQSLQHSETLRQSILKRAFEGKLI